MTSGAAEMYVRARAPARPPMALASPKRTNMCRFTWPRRVQKRTAVATKWGMATTATANLMPMPTARAGVSRLPIPNPVTEAMPAAKTAAAMDSPIM